MDFYFCQTSIYHFCYDKLYVILIFVSNGPLGIDYLCHSLCVYIVYRLLGTIVYVTDTIATRIIPWWSSVVSPREGLQLCIINQSFSSLSPENISFVYYYTWVTKFSLLGCFWRAECCMYTKSSYLTCILTSELNISKVVQNICILCF